MANTLSPFGFRHVGYLGGYKPNYAPDTRLVSKTNTTPIYVGDPVTTLNTGYIAQSTAGTTQIAGIMQSVNFQSISRNGQTTRSLYWPGTDALADGAAQIISHPLALFLVQCNAQALPSHVGMNANFALGTGNTASQQSGATIDISTVATTNTLPFRIWQLASNNINVPWLPSLSLGAPGADGTTAYNCVYVTFNNQDFKSLTGI